MVVPDSPPHQRFSSECDSPTVHTPKAIRAAHNIESKKQAPATPSHVVTTGSKGEEPTNVASQRLPDNPFPKRVILIPYHRLGTPYRKVDPLGRETEALETRILDKTDDSFEIDSESERTLTEESKETPKIKISSSEMPEGITKRRIAPVVLPFDIKAEKGPKKKLVRTKTKSTVNPKIKQVEAGKESPEARPKVEKAQRKRPREKAENIS